MLSDWGRPTEGIFQTAFVVEDLDAAIQHFSSRLYVGPWTILRDVDPRGAVYRGLPALATLHVAFGFGGHMTYELVQPVDDAPSVYRDVIEDRGYGFHHFGYGHRTSITQSRRCTLTVTRQSVASRRLTFVLRFSIPETTLPGMTELIEVAGERR